MYSVNIRVKILKFQTRHMTKIVVVVRGAKQNCTNFVVNFSNILHYFNFKTIPLLVVLFSTDVLTSSLLCKVNRGTRHKFFS